MGQDNHIKRAGLEIDPDFFDVLIQSLSVLSNVATMASTWLVFRQDRNRTRSEHNLDAIRVALRGLRRQLEDCFESVENILRVHEAAHTRSTGGGDILQTRPQFGAGVLLNTDELNRMYQFLQQLETAAGQARSHARHIQVLLQNTDVPEAEHIVFDTAAFNDDLNSTLFGSATFGEAMEKLRGVQRRAEDFVSDVAASLRGN